jgi:hypothetical protein
LLLVLVRDLAPSRDTGLTPRSEAGLGRFEYGRPCTETGGDQCAFNASRVQVAAPQSQNSIASSPRLDRRQMGPCGRRRVVRAVNAIFAASLLWVVWRQGGLSAERIEVPQCQGGYIAGAALSQKRAGITFGSSGGFVKIHTQSLVIVDS